jgi:hypothetical protein
MLCFWSRYGRRVKGGWNAAEDVSLTHNVTIDGDLQFFAQIKQLQEGEKYTVRVRARNEMGWSDWSKKSSMIGTAKFSAFRAEKQVLVAPAAAAGVRPGRSASEPPPRRSDGDPPLAPLKPSESAEGHGT